MIVFAPAVAAAMIVLTVRDRSRRREGLAAILFGSAVFACLVSVSVTVGLLYDRSFGVAAGIDQGTGPTHLSIRGFLSYLWQYFLPRLPSMHRPPWPSYVGYGVWNQYIQGFIGRFGWWEYVFSRRVNFVGLALLLVVAALALVGLARTRSLRTRASEIGCYVLVVLTLLGALAYTAYRYLAFTGDAFEQTRYLFPLLAFYGAAVALAARGAGQRWGRAVGSCLVVFAMGHYLLAIVLTLQRYYT
jgi:hypothetical protein